MSEQGLSITVGADVSGAVKGFQKLSKDVGTSMKSAENSVKQFAQANQRATAQLAGTTAKAGEAVKKTGKDFTNFGRVLQDLPYGFQGIQNNLTQLIPATGAVGLAFTGLVSALTFAQVGLSYWIRGAKDAQDEAKDLAGSIRTTNDVFSHSRDEYVKAFETVGRMTQQVKLAKEGFIDKKAVVGEYNKTLGETIGKVSSLDELEKKLAASGQAYIKFTLLKAAANVALGKAAEEAFKAEEKRFGKINTANFGRVFNPERTAAQNATANAKIVALANQANNKLEAEANRFDQQQARFTEIAAAFQKEAAKISKDFAFDFFGSKDVQEKTKKDLSGILKRIFAEMQLPDLRIAIIPEIKNDDKQAINAYLNSIKRAFEARTGDNKINPIDLAIGEREAKKFEQFTEVGRQIGNRVGAGFGEVFSSKFKGALIAAQAAGLSGQALEGFKTELAAIAQLQAQLFEGLGNAFGAFADALVQGKNAMAAFSSAIKSALAGIAAQLLKTVALAAVLSLLTGGASKGGLSFLQAFKKILGGLPGHRDGLERVPYDGYVAKLHKNEMVLTAEQAKALRGIGSGSVQAAPVARNMQGLANAATNIILSGELVARGKDLVYSLTQTQMSQKRAF